MAEWSKAVDLRPTIVRCEGSNPSGCNITRLCFKIKKLIVTCFIIVPHSKTKTKTKTKIKIKYYLNKRNMQNLTLKLL